MLNASENRNYARYVDKLFDFTNVVKANDFSLTIQFSIVVGFPFSITVVLFDSGINGLDSQITPPNSYITLGDNTSYDELNFGLRDNPILLDMISLRDLTNMQLFGSEPFLFTSKDADGKVYQWNRMPYDDTTSAQVNGMVDMPFFKPVMLDGKTTLTFEVFIAGEGSGNLVMTFYYRPMYKASLLKDIWNYDTLFGYGIQNEFVDRIKSDALIKFDGTQR